MSECLMKGPTFHDVETLFLDPKRFLHSKGPKNAICLWLRLKKSNRIKQCRFNIVRYFLVSAIDKLHFEDFGVSIYNMDIKVYLTSLFHLDRV